MIHEDIVVSGSIHHSNQITVPKYADPALAAAKTGSLIYDTTVNKFKTLTDSLLDKTESKRFLDLVQRLPELSAEEVKHLNVTVDQNWLKENKVNQKGIF